MPSYRVDTLPWALRPLVALYGYGIALGWYAVWCLLRLTVRVRVEGAERLDPSTNYIFCNWHGTIPLLLQCSAPRLPRALAGSPQSMLQHPLWHMKPIHVLLRLMGVTKLVLGSTGHEGRSAADKLVGYLRSGHSALMFPDGPAGPPRVLKKGVLHMAVQSGVPIVPLRFEATRRLRVCSWDRKQFAVPFSTIRLRIGEPIVVVAEGLEDAERALTEALSSCSPRW